MEIFKSWYILDGDIYFFGGDILNEDIYIFRGDILDEDIYIFRGDQSCDKSMLNN